MLRKQEELGKILLKNQSDKTWTAWVTADPVSLVQNVFGGGKKQDIELALAQLKVELVQLKVRQESLVNSVSENILLLLSEYSRLNSEKVKLESRSKVKQTQMAIIRIKYLQGGSSHAEMAKSQETMKDLLDKVDSLQIQSNKILLELQKLVGVIGVIDALETNLVDHSN